MQILALVAVITFVSPQQGSQAIGVLPLEVTTNIAGVNRVEFYVDGALIGVARQQPYRILHDFGTSLAGHDILAKVYSNNFLSVDSARIATAAMTAGETVHVDLVEVPMRVRSSHPLRADDIRIAENRIEQAIREVRSDRGPARS